MLQGNTAQIAEAVITASEAHLKAEGFVVVPVIPTDAMDLAGSREVDSTNPYPRDVAANIYTAMIRAAAQEPSNASEDGRP
jgi:hypothetical protein